MFRFGRSSTKRLGQLHPDIQAILVSAIQVKDFSIIEAHRDEETQNRYFNATPKVSHLKFPESKHNQMPSLAVDVWPYVTHIAGVRVNAALNGSREQLDQLAETTQLGHKLLEAYVKEEFMLLQGIIRGVAHALEIELRFGYDWNSNGDRLDQSFHDLPHLELG